MVVVVVGGGGGGDEGGQKPLILDNAVVLWTRHKTSNS